MQAFISKEGCIRVVIDQLIDRRVDQVECKDREEACQRCQAQRATTNVQEVAEELSVEAEEGVEVQESTPSLLNI